MLNYFDNKYPYTDLHEMNLDWIISRLIQMDHKLTNFVSLNTIKYADPIQWNIASQYETNTVVVDPITGIAYISTQPVPSGVSLGNTAYWSEIFNLQQIIGNITDNLTLNDNGQSPTLIFSASIGDWILWNNKLYVATANMSAGTALIVGSNVDEANVEDLTKYYTDVVNNNLTAIIGALANLQTSDTSSIVNAINSVLSDTASVIGNLNNLNTTDKTAIVNAINEVLGDLNTLQSNVGNLQSNVGNLNNLITSDKTSIVNAINEVSSMAERIYINVLYPPAGITPLDNTGATDNTSLIQDILTYIDNSGNIGACIFFPRGTYLINGTINVTRNHVRFLGEEMGGTRFECRNTLPTGLDMFYITGRFITFEHIAFWIKGDNTYVNTFIHSYGGRNITMYQCHLYDAKYPIHFNNTPGLRCQNIWCAFDSITYSNAILWHLSGMCNSSYFLNCVGSNLSSTGVAMKIEDHPQDIFIEHFETSRSGIGIEISSNGIDKTEDVQIVDCVIDEPNQYGIYIHDLTSISEVSILGGVVIPRINGGRAIRIENCKNIKINASKVTNYHNLTNVDGITLAGVVENVLVEGCYFYNINRPIISISAAANSYKSISFNNNLIVNDDYAGGLVAYYKVTSGSVSNNTFKGNISSAISLDSTNSNIMCVGNNGLTNSAVSNNYSGAYSATGFDPTVINCFTT